MGNIFTMTKVRKEHIERYFEYFENDEEAQELLKSLSTREIKCAYQKEYSLGIDEFGAVWDKHEAEEYNIKIELFA